MTADVIEIIWSALAAIGLGFSSVGLHHSIADLRYLRSKKFNGLKSILAIQGRRREAIRVTVQSMFLCVGVISMLRPPAVLTHRGDMARYVTIGILVSASALMAYGSWADLRDRKKAMSIDG